MLRLPRKARRKVLFFCLAGMFCFSTSIAAQSRRVPQKTNPASPEQTAPVEQKKIDADKTAPDTMVPDEKAPARISSLRIVGEIQHNFTYYKSNNLDNAIREFIRTLELYSKSARQLANGGEMNYTEAKERAKKETDAFILWLGFAAKDDGAGNVYIHSVQYAVIKPQTGEILTRGEIEPGKSRPGNPVGGVIIPGARRRPTELRQMKDAVREIAALLTRGGWLD